MRMVCAEATTIVVLNSTWGLVKSAHPVIDASPWNYSAVRTSTLGATATPLGWGLKAIEVWRISTNGLMEGRVVLL